MCEEDLQTVLMQYCAMKDIILSMVENFDFMAQYICLMIVTMTKVRLFLV